MKEVFEAILTHQQRGEDCVLISAVGGEGSAPRKAQSHMLLNHRGRVCGTVGGGAVEGNSLAFAQQLLERRESGFKIFELYEHATEDIGMICGGRVHVHFQWIAYDDEVCRAVAEAAVRAWNMASDLWLIIDTFHHTLSAYDGSRCVGPKIPAGLYGALNASAFTNGHCYAEQLVSGNRVYIFGGGHVAQALVPVLASVDFRCVVIEYRPEFSRRELFPEAYDVRLLTQDKWETALEIGHGDCICIMTRGHQNDLACQAFALKTQAGYIGVIGSRRKIAAVNAQLRAMGFEDVQIARIVTPIGLEIGAVTPAEIAVSIAAQMIAYRAAHRNAPVEKSCMA